MPSITLKNIPEPLYQKIKESSQQNRRSITAEILYCLEKNLLHTNPPNKITLDEIRRNRSLSKRHLLTQEDIVRAKSEGRK